MKKQNLIYLVLAIIISAAIYAFFVFESTPEPPQLTEETSEVTPDNNPNYERYKQQQIELQKSLDR